MELGKTLKRWLWDDPALGYDDPGNNPMSCPEITVNGIDPQLHDKLLAQATAAGAKFDGENATIEGVVFHWNYDAASQTLSITCLKKPFFISCGQIQCQITELINKAKTEGV